MKATYKILGVVFWCAVSLSADTVETIFLRGDMSPANEFPAITTVTASARGTIALHVQKNSAGEVVSGVVDFDVDYSFAQPATVDGLHIHDGAAGVNGPITIDSRISDSNPVAVQGSGNIFRSVAVTSGFALDTLKGMLVNPANYYVNLHTTANPGGLMRDQLRVSPPPAPAFPANGVVNNAGYTSASSSIAPGSIAAIFGTRLTDGTSCLPPACNAEFGNNGRLKTTMAGARVTVNGVETPVFYASRGQLGIQLPFELTGTSATVQVTVAGQSSAAQTVSIAPVAPGIFSQTADGKGAAAITHADGKMVTAQNPAQPGEILILYATGLGQITPAVPTGAVPGGETAALTKPAVTMGGVSAELKYWGLSGCCVGLNQLNIVVPPGSGGGDLSLVLSMGNVQANAVTVAVAGSSAPPPASNPVPAIASLSPSSAYAGDPAMTLTINGTGFMTESTATFNGASKPVTFVGDTRLIIPLTAADLSRTGSYSVVVSNPAPGGGSSNIVNLVVVTPPPEPPPYDYGY